MIKLLIVLAFLGWAVLSALIVYYRPDEEEDEDQEPHDATDGG